MPSGARVVLLALALAGCATADLGEPPKASASMGLIIARDRCSSCHVTGGPGQSPNPDAPPFGEIVNRPGATEENLRTWLRDSHNYPIEMGFRLEPHQVDSLVAYMMRWKVEGAPPQS